MKWPKKKSKKKGMKLGIVGRLQTGSYTDKEGVKRYTTDVIIEEVHFMEAKAVFEARIAAKANGTSGTEGQETSKASNDGYVAIDNFDDDDLPFKIS